MPTSPPTIATLKNTDLSSSRNRRATTTYRIQKKKKRGIKVFPSKFSDHPTRESLFCQENDHSPSPRIFFLSAVTRSVSFQKTQALNLWGHANPTEHRVRISSSVLPVAMGLIIESIPNGNRFTGPGRLGSLGSANLPQTVINGYQRFPKFRKSFNVFPRCDRKLIDSDLLHQLWNRLGEAHSPPNGSLALRRHIKKVSSPWPPNVTKE